MNRLGRALVVCVDDELSVLLVGWWRRDATAGRPLGTLRARAVAFEPGRIFRDDLLSGAARFDRRLDAVDEVDIDIGFGSLDI